MKVTSFQTTQRVTFQFIATAIVPVGFTLLVQAGTVTKLIGLACILSGLGALVLREKFKVTENV